MKELLVQKSKEKNIEKSLKNSRTICEKIARLLKSLISISVPIFKTVGRCLKPVRELVLVMTLVLSHKFINSRT